MKKPTQFIIFLAIISLAGFFRLKGLNWDQNHHLHPDERFLTMVTGEVSWPSSLREYLDPSQSPLNPYNNGYGFFVYGTLPLKMVKAAAGFFEFDDFDYNNITLVGRAVSAFFDLGTLLLVYCLAKELFGRKTALFVAFFYALSVLPVQLSHFYAVDTFLVFFLTLTFYLLVLFMKKPCPKLAVFLAIAFGLALACKITAALIVSILGLGFFFCYVSVILRGTSADDEGSPAVNRVPCNRRGLFGPAQTWNCRVTARFIFLGLIFVSVSYFTFRFADPRVFADSSLLNPTPNPQFISNLKELKSFNDPENWFPPAVQWINTTPIIFPLKNLVLWGLGTPLALLVFGGLVLAGWSVFEDVLGKRMRNCSGGACPAFGEGDPWVAATLKSVEGRGDRRNRGILLMLVWVVGVFVFQGTRFAKAMRYFYPIYPFLAVLAGWFFARFWLRSIELLSRKVHLFLAFLVLFFVSIWPLSFMAIYSREHSRVQASHWIYENIPADSVISCEHWDDCLPLGIKGYAKDYETITLHLYDKDTKRKWEKINTQLEKIDYLVLSSNRLWGSIPRVPGHYPRTAKFYKHLFAGKTEFKKAVEFTSYPTVPFLGIEIVDDSADESFTVYDHPKVLIYKKVHKKKNEL